MNYKKIVPTWLSVVLLVLCVAAIVYNVYAFINALQIDKSSIKPIVDTVALVAAISYALKGYSKDAAKFFMIVVVAFLVSSLIGVFAASPIVVSMICEAIIIGCLCTFAVAKDIGKRKSQNMAITIVIVCLIDVIYTFVARDFNVLAISSSSSKLLLSIVFFIMTYAKFKDKEDRGTN